MIDSQTRPFLKLGRASSRWVARTLALALLALGTSLSGCGCSRDRVQVLNGFDFPVVLEITPQGGAARTLEVPARGRVGFDLVGQANVKVKTAGGEVIDEGPANFAQADQPEHCLAIYNVLGSAAIETKEIIY